MTDGNGIVHDGLKRCIDLVNPIIFQVRIASHFLTSNNRQVRSRQLWGSDVYTSDSDLVAVLMHFGYVHHTITQPIRDILEVRAVVKPCEALKSYPSTPRNSIRSRAWNAPITGCSYTVEKAWVVTRMGSSYDLRASIEGIPAVAQTFAPMHLERIVTRSSVGAAAARHRMVQEVTAVFNLVNEPWHKYTPATICDRGLKPHDWTSSRLHTQALYAESHQERYELSRMGTLNSEHDMGEKFRWSRCKRAMTARAMRGIGVPLPDAEKDELAKDLLWEELVWGPSFVIIRGIKYSLLRIHFMEIEAPKSNLPG